MDISQALEDLGVTEQALTQEKRAELDEKGYTVLPGLIDGPWLAALRERFESLCEAEGAGAGLEVHQETGTRRLADLVNKGAAFDHVYTHPTVLAGIHHVIGRDFKLSSLNARDALPGEGTSACTPTGPPTTTGVSTSATRFGCLMTSPTHKGERMHARLVPGTHKGRHPGGALEDALAPHPNEDHLVAPAGTTAQRAIDRPPAVSSHCRPAQGAVATVPTRTKPSGSPRRSRRTVHRTWQGK